MATGSGVKQSWHTQHAWSRGVAPLQSSVRCKQDCVTLPRAACQVSPRPISSQFALSHTHMHACTLQPCPSTALFPRRERKQWTPAVACPKANMCLDRQTPSAFPAQVPGAAFSTASTAAARAATALLLVNTSPAHIQPIQARRHTGA